MAITFGKIERIVEIPVGNLTCTLHETVDLSDTLTTTLAAGEESFISSGYSGDSGAGNTLLAKLKAALDAAGSKTYTVSIAAGENATGKITISADTGNFGITWVGTALRNLLGFTQGNLSGAGTYTGASQAKSLWLPDTPMISMFGAGDAGFYESDALSTESPSGHVKSIYSNRKQINEIRWEGLTHAKCRLSAETTTNTSFETFWVDSVIAEASWAASPGGILRFYWDAADDSSYTDYKSTGDMLSIFNPQQMTEGWLGLWNIAFDRLVVVP